MTDLSDIREIGLNDATRRDPDRLAAVRATGLLDSEVEEVFDRLTRLAVRLLRIPAAFISLVDAERDFYKSACGFGEPLRSTRELAGPTFCHYTVRRSTPLVIPDTADPKYRDVPTVRSLGVASYVGVPLVIGGQSVGALCAIDVRPHQWTADEVEVLVELAASAQREMELRGAVAAANAAIAAFELQRVETERANHTLQEQAVELEMQAEELQATSAHLEERTEEAEAANDSKSQFLWMMSHELRTPLNAIIGYADLLGMGVRGPVNDDQTQFLERIRRAGRHLQTLIGDILDFARIDAGQVTYDLRDVLVADAVGEAVELIAPQLNERGISLLAPPADAATRSVLLVRADPSRLRQIIVNLLTNAMKFTQSGGQVRVACDRTPTRIQIAIADNGRGIDSSQLTRIFEPFVQLDRSGVSPGQEGVGLGLPICRELARGMGGDLAVESELGVGSTFTVMLPAA